MVENNLSKDEQHIVRVLLLISNLEYGGAQRQVVELANTMDHSKFEVHICSLSDFVPLASQFDKSSSRLHIVKKYYKFDITVVARLALLLQKLRINIVHSYLFDANIAARLAGALSGTTAIINSERNTNYHLKRRQLITYRLTKRWVDLFIANSKAGADFNRLKLGHDASLYRVVHNGVDIQRFMPRDSRETLHSLGISDDENVVGMFASFKQQKNHAFFFEAARRLLDQLPKTRFLFVGDMLYAGMHGSDEYKKQMDCLIDDLKIRNRCIFLGNREDVVELYNVCDITVLPSLFEGTPNVLLESMACGIPVVATNVSDNVQIVQDGRTGNIIELGDIEGFVKSLYSLLSNHDRRAEMGKNARNWVAKQFSVQALASKTEKEYLELLQRGR